MRHSPLRPEMVFFRPSKIVCIGRNYAKHAAELGNEIPKEPLLFLKAPSSLIRSGEAIVLPTGFGRVEHEGEIGVVIGQPARNVKAEDAWSYVAAFVPVNDVTARELQKKDGQWSRAKGFDTFCPVGTPVPADQVRHEDMVVRTLVNGEVRQEGSVRDMVFAIPFLIAHISRVMTLEPGDLILTGTPEGVGVLNPGDEVEVEISGVGSVKNPVRAEA